MIDITYNSGAEKMLKYSFIHKSQSNIEMDDWGVINPLNIHNQVRNNSKYSPLHTKSSLHRTLKGRDIVVALRTDMKYKLHRNILYK